MSGRVGAGLLKSPCFAAFTWGGEKRRGGLLWKGQDLRGGEQKGKSLGVRTGGLGTSCIYSLWPALQSC